MLAGTQGIIHSRLHSGCFAATIHREFLEQPVGLPGWQAKPVQCPVVLKGDIQADAKALRDAADGGAHMAFDMVGGANSPNATLAALRSLRRGG